MKLVVATYGTEGDARPLAALCRAAMDAGHEARLLADAATLGSAQALGVPATPLTGDIRAVASAKEPIAGVVAKGGGFRATARALANMANENAASWMRAIVRPEQAATRSSRLGSRPSSAFRRPNISASRASAAA